MGFPTPFLYNMVLESLIFASERTQPPATDTVGPAPGRNLFPYLSIPATGVANTTCFGTLARGMEGGQPFLLACYLSLN